LISLHIELFEEARREKWEAIAVFQADQCHPGCTEMSIALACERNEVIPR